MLRRAEIYPLGRRETVDEKRQKQLAGYSQGKVVVN